MTSEQFPKAKFSLKIRTDKERADYLQKKVTELLATHIDKAKVKEVIEHLLENSKGTYTEEGTFLLVKHLKKELRLE